MGRQDPICAKVFKQVRGIVFLATPHGGASDAKLLNSILETSPFSTSRKEYIAQLEPTSHMLQDINDQFSRICGELVLVSFYETMRTVFAWGVKRIVRSVTPIAGILTVNGFRLWRGLLQYWVTLRSIPAPWLRITTVFANLLTIGMRIMYASKVS